MSITREMSRFLLGVYLGFYLCSGVWVNAMPPQ